MKTLLKAALAAICLGLSGCGAGHLMREAPSQEMSTPSAGKAKIVFMRTSFVAGAIGCDIFEVVNGELRYAGQLPMGNRIVVETTPGEKVFMAYGTAADFMLANVAAGKTYYAIVRPNWGTGGFYPTPVRVSGRPGDPDQNSKEFKDSLSGTKLIVPTEGASVWFTENKQRMQSIYADYWGRFQRKNSQEKLERTMQLDDGR